MSLSVHRHDFHCRCSSSFTSFISLLPRWIMDEAARCLGDMPSSSLSCTCSQKARSTALPRPPPPDSTPATSGWQTSWYIDTRCSHRDWVLAVVHELMKMKREGLGRRTRRHRYAHSYRSHRGSRELHICPLLLIQTRLSGRYLPPVLHEWMCIT